MRFVFRAQVALDLRRKQEDDARRALAAAQAREREAQDALARALSDLDAMMRRASEADAREGETTARIWYRNWIAGQRQRIARCRESVRARRADVEAATGVAQAARRKVKSLERLRERAWRRHSLAERHAEQKALDQLGTLQFALVRTNRGGDT